MELASSVGQVVEAGGFFRQQGALGSVSVCLGHLPLLGQVVLEWGILVMQAICAKNIKRILLQAQINKIDKVKVCTNL